MVVTGQMDRAAAPSAEPPTTRRWVTRALALAFLSGSVFLLMAGTAAALDIDDPLGDVTGVVDDATGVVDGATGAVTDTAEPVLENVTDTVEPVLENVTDTVEPIVVEVIQTVDEVTDTVEPIVDEVVKTVDEVTDAVEPIVDDVTDTISNVVDPIVDVVEPIVDDTTDAIGDVTDPILGGTPPTEDGVVAPPDTGGGTPPSDDGVVATPDTGGGEVVEPGLPGSDDGDAPDQSGVALVFGDAEPLWDAPSAVTGIAPVAWYSSASDVPTAFGDLAERRNPSSSVMPVASPLGGVDPGGAFGAAGLLAIVGLSTRLLLPLIRSPNAPRVPPLRSAALALSVERPG